MINAILESNCLDDNDSSDEETLKNLNQNKFDDQTLIAKECLENENDKEMNKA